MLTSRDKMFKTDDEEQTQLERVETVTPEDMDELAVTILDGLAVRIVDEEVTVEDITITPGRVDVGSNGHLRTCGKSKLEVEYYAN